MDKIMQVATVDGTLTRQIPALLRRIREKGLALTCISARPTNPSFFDEIGADHVSLHLTRRITPMIDLSVLLKLYFLFRRERPIVVHTHTPKANLLGQLAAYLARVPVRIVTIHGFYFTPDTPYLRRVLLIWMERWTVRWSQLLFLVNEEDCASAIRLRICTPEKVRLLTGGNGIDLSRYNRRATSADQKRLVRNELSIPDTAKVVGFVGRLVRTKGLSDLFTAAQMVRTRIPSVVFLIVGPVDAERSDAFDPASELPRSVAGICRFTGFREDTPALYAIMDVFVLPSYREGMPMSLMEAAAMAIPSVVTDIRGCRAIVEHEQSGLVVPVHSPQKIATAVIRLLEDQELARRLGENAEATAQARFDAQTSAESVVAEYTRLLSESIRRPTPHVSAGTPQADAKLGAIGGQ